MSLQTGQHTAVCCESRPETTAQRYCSGVIILILHCCAAWASMSIAHKQTFPQGRRKPREKQKRKPTTHALIYYLPGSICCAGFFSRSVLVIFELNSWKFFCPPRTAFWTKRWSQVSSLHAPRYKHSFLVLHRSRFRIYQDGSSRRFSEGQSF